MSGSDLFPNLHAPTHGVRGEFSEPWVVEASLVYALLATARLDLTNEKATQAEAERVLAEHIPPHLVSREHRLGPGDIPDFLLGGRIVIELKGPRHRAPEVLRQLRRYAAYPEVQAIVVATARAMTLPALLPREGAPPVPIAVLNLGQAWL